VTPSPTGSELLGGHEGVLTVVFILPGPGGSRLAVTGGGNALILKKYMTPGGQTYRNLGRWCAGQLLQLCLQIHYA
jgi:hypothetical protein